MRTSSDAIKNAISLILKGAAMGAANVIPGVSGGTIALVTGVFERLVNALKSFDLTAVRLGLRFRVAELWRHVDGGFLLPLGIGLAVSVFNLASLLEFLLEEHEVATFAFFFGLILASIYYVGQAVRKWTAPAGLAAVAGCAIAAAIAFLTAAGENASPVYLFVCGAVAVCSMILPGLSGSFVLLIMGNYALVLGAIYKLQLSILIPMALGCGVGLIAFAHLLALLLRRFHDIVIALMTGFVAGSLLIIWPWKTIVTERVEVDGKTKEVITGYADWRLPEFDGGGDYVAVGMLLVGVVAMVGVEAWAAKRHSGKTTAG